MKRSFFISVLCILIVLTVSVSCQTVHSEKKEERYVSAIFQKEEAQKYIEDDEEAEFLDTIWIYYSDGTFEQYAMMDDTAVLFSSGTYAVVSGSFASLPEGEETSITIRRSSKYQNGEFAAYSSEHMYDLGTLGFDEIYAYRENGHRIEAVFFGDDRQLFVESDGDREMLDTIWIYYDDMSFEQFALLDGHMRLFSRGSYAFSDGGDFFYEEKASDCGDITITRSEKYQAGKGLSAYSSSHTYDLNSLGFEKIVMPSL